MFKRKFEVNLKKWKENYIKKPLLVIGARQVGKTFIIKKFINDNFDNYIYINFDEEKKYAEFFQEDLNPERIIRDIANYRNQTINIKKTIFFFDEVQKSEEVIASLKYFEESDQEYKIICAGSLLGVLLNRFTKSFPVGKVYFEYMFPMDFEEFLWALDEENLSERIVENYKSMKPLPNPLHEKALELYYKYLYIGGMPEAIKEFLAKEKDIQSFDRGIQQNIISAYLADMAKYADSHQIIKTVEVYNSISHQLAKKNKKFIYKNINERAKSKTHGNAISWLIDAGLVLKCNRLDKLEKPFKFYELQNDFKLYLSDVGLLCKLSDFSYSAIAYKEGTEFRGVLAENYIAQQLTSNKVPLYYRTETRDIEVDFMIIINEKIIPIEVKASSNTKSLSLNKMQDKYNFEYSIRISSKNFGFVNKIKSVPLYAVYLIKQI